MCASAHSAKQTINLQHKKKWQEKPTLKTLLTEAFMDVTYLQSTITVLLICLLVFFFFLFFFVLFFFSFLFFLFFFFFVFLLFFFCFVFFFFGFCFVLFFFFSFFFFFFFFFFSSKKLVKLCCKGLCRGTFSVFSSKPHKYLIALMCR